MPSLALYGARYPSLVRHRYSDSSAQGRLRFGRTGVCRDLIRAIWMKKKKARHGQISAAS